MGSAGTERAPSLAIVIFAAMHRIVLVFYDTLTPGDLHAKGLRSVHSGEHKGGEV